MGVLLAGMHDVNEMVKGSVSECLQNLIKLVTDEGDRERKHVSMQVCKTPLRDKRKLLKQCKR